jgi:hypothetical protein
MKYSMAAVIIAGSIFVNINAPAEAAVPVVWDGTAGISSNPTLPVGVRRWEEGNWTKEGMTGLTANDAIGQDGTTGGRGGVDIVIGLGHTVYHDQNRGLPEGVAGGLGDFKPRMDLFGPGSLTITDGATLWMDAHTDTDGRWTRVGMDINLDNGTLLRTLNPAYCPGGGNPCSVSGGRIIYGYQNELLPNTRIDITLTNGGEINSHGKVVYGNPDFISTTNPSAGHNAGIEVHTTINDGIMDLTGGNAYDDFFGLVNGEIIFFYLWDGVTNTAKNETYDVNFTGPGQIIVDNGLFVVDQDSTGTFNPKGGLQPDLFTSYTYENLWTLGILQANGLSGMTGATFGDYFTVTGSPGAADYTLTSLLAPPGQDGDHNGDGVVDLADYVTWRKDPSAFGGDPDGYDEWRANFGEPGAGSGGAVPEPMGILSVVLGAAALVTWRRSPRSKVI